MALSLSAQPRELQTNFDTYVFGDKVNVRMEPSSDAKVVAQLVGGDKVTILENTEKTHTANGTTLPWSKVRFGKGQTGYVWSGLLSFAGNVTHDKLRFTVGLTNTKAGSSPDEMADCTFEMRVFDEKGAIVDKNMVNIPTTGGANVWTELSPEAGGLAGYKAVLKVNIGYEACGYPQYDWYLLWTGTKSVALPLCNSISDADVFHHIESYVFPQPLSENDRGHFGEPDQLFFMVSHGESTYPDDNDTAGWNEDSWVRARPMVWDGKKYIRPVIEDKK